MFWNGILPNNRSVKMFCFNFRMTYLNDVIKNLLNYWRLICQPIYKEGMTRITVLSCSRKYQDKAILPKSLTGCYIYPAINKKKKKSLQKYLLWTVLYK